MGKPRYRFVIDTSGEEPFVRMEMLPEPPPTPERFQRKARFRRLGQQRRRNEITACEYLDGLAVVHADYDVKP